MSVSDVGLRKKYLSILSFGGFAAIAAGVVITACTDRAKAKINFVHKDPPRPGLIGKIGDQEYTEETLFKDNMLELIEARKRLYDLYVETFKKRLVTDLVGAEAKQAGMSLDDYVKKITGGDIKISDGEYKKFVADKHIPETQINPQIKERIISYLQTLKSQERLDDHLAKLTAKNPPILYVTKPKMQIDVAAGDGPSYGKDGAPITVVEFSDFQCPFCSRAADTVTQLKKKYGNKIKLTFRHFPLPMHRDARPTAEASMCVNEQGTDKFWKFHDLAFKNQDKLDKASVEKYAKTAGADVKKFNECIASKKYVDVVQKDISYGEKIGVKSTPTFFINGQLVSGAVPIESFSEIIDDELADKK